MIEIYVESMGPEKEDDALRCLIEEELKSVSLPAPYEILFREDICYTGTYLPEYEPAYKKYEDSVSDIIDAVDRAKARLGVVS